MNLRKIWLIAKREYWVNFRRKSFLLTAFLLPVVLVAVMSIVVGVIAQSEDDISGFKAVGVVDKSGLIRSDTKIETPFVLIASEEEAAKRLADHTLDGYYVVAANYLNTASVEAYYRQTLALNAGLRDELGRLLKQALATKVGDPQLAARLESPMKELEIYRTGNPTKLDESALMAAIFVPLAVGMLVMLMTMGTSQYLMQGLVEEKENRMMEVLATSSRPSEMLWGKLLGLGTLGLTMVLVWALMALGFATLRGTVDLGQLLATIQITPGFILVVLIYTFLGYAVFGAIQAGLGATVTAEQESRQVASIVSLIATIPMILMIVFLTDPNGGVAMFLSLFPLTAPISMVFRIALTVVPMEQIILSIALMILTLIGVMWLAARIFRIGMLSYGKRLSLREIVRGLREGRQVVSEATSKEVAQ